ncbi:histidine phosphatase superfamily [Amylocarpus encephaloides]|uniref:3-phytase n=1 Tax=Amylocarpus encephaloides TaxID=45428 RepID=A0A9P7YG40_9HELO|nr:histidine phosphatase superfamily [Amylocarpus encephaloides]
MVDPGPNVNGVGKEVPEGCGVENVAYVVRHGSRYPDRGAYGEWTALYSKIQAANFTANGSLSFLKAWKPALTNPEAQIAQESSTGYKEAYDLGYSLRTRYPDLYEYGSPFMAWANLYPRVVQTAQNFVRGFLGSRASTLGRVITVNSTGSPLALFDSLAPSDGCPTFVDGNGGDEATKWNSIYLPPITARLNTLIASGSLDITDADTRIMPYLCGYESQITGTLSPWCGVFDDAELRGYEYAQDLRYYYGVGDGVDLASKMMLPFLDSLLGHVGKGRGRTGKGKDGGSFGIPEIIAAFLNDGQLTELVSATGVLGDQKKLNGSAIPVDAEWRYRASRFVTMRGTVAFERLSCPSLSSHSSTNSTTSDHTYIRILLNDAVYPHPSCHDGPGKSCALHTYQTMTAKKLEAAGDLRTRCNISASVLAAVGNGTSGSGASFLGDLGGSWVGSVVP